MAKSRVVGTTAVGAICLLAGLVFVAGGDGSTANVSGDTVPEIVMPDLTGQTDTTMPAADFEADDEDAAEDARSQGDDSRQKGAEPATEIASEDSGTPNGDAADNTTGSDNATEGQTANRTYVPRIVTTAPQDIASTPFGEQASSTREPDGSLNPDLAPTPTVGQIEDAQQGDVVSTTAAPTTAAPTSAAPVSEDPTTTSSSTTEVPTTEPAPTERRDTVTSTSTTEAASRDSRTAEAPTTEAPTTVAPTTPGRTETVPTTAVPTTAVPTTAVPTTEEPLEAPTTTEPNTKIISPTTAPKSSTTAPSTTAAPTTTAQSTTAAPTTAAPTTAAPTTGAPTTATPTTAAPTTAAPTTAAPTTAPPTTMPMTEHPMNDHSSASNDLGDLDNPLVVSNYTNVPSNQLNISALTSDFTGSIAPHNKQGQFRTRCQYSHFAYDDPIVFPNQPGAAHLHMFFGNTETNAHSTGQSLLNSGGGSCQGGELNRSAYWMPAVFDGNDDVRIPYDFVTYYKTNRSDLVEAMPTGLMMVTNTAASTPKVKWSCARNRDVNLEYNIGDVMPNCDNGDMVKASIGFPECWDGRLDSGDHKSHLEYMKQDTCPSSHPRVIPTITYNVYFQHDGNTADWYLSSDRMHGAAQHPNGSTLHADWLGAWNEDVMDEWTTNCTQAQFTCHVGPISADTKLKSFSNDDRYHGPNTISDNRLQPSLH